jgi:hypothetical protein
MLSMVVLDGTEDKIHEGRQLRIPDGADTGISKGKLLGLTCADDGFSEGRLLGIPDSAIDGIPK